MWVPVRVLCVRWQCLQSNVIYNHFHLIRCVAVTVVVAITVAGWSMYRLWFVHIEWFNFGWNRNAPSPLDFGIFGFLLITVHATMLTALTGFDFGFRLFVMTPQSATTVHCFELKFYLANWLLLLANVVLQFPSPQMYLFNSDNIAAIRFMVNKFIS